MAWKARLRKASFRGISFQVASADLDAGRRIVNYEYPERDIGSTEDLGRKTREYSIEAFVIGDDYFDKRDALLKACEDEKGPGELIHPFLGSLDVVCKGCRMRESMSTDGRMATFSLSFSEAGLVADPSSTVDVKSTIFSAAQDAKSKAQSKMAKAFSVLNQPGHIISAAQAKIDSAAAAIQDNPVKGAAQSIADFSYKLRNLKASATSLMQQPSQLAAYLSDSISGLQEVSGLKGESYKSYAVLAVHGASISTNYSNTEEGQVEKKNAEAIDHLVQEVAVINSVETVIEKAFDSFQDAAAEKEAIIANFDRIIDQNFDDELYISLGKLKAIFISSFPLDGQDLPNLVKLKTIETLPSLVISYQYYGDARKEGDIVKRNKIANPAFIPGGLELEVINE